MRELTPLLATLATCSFLSAHAQTGIVDPLLPSDLVVLDTSNGSVPGQPRSWPSEVVFGEEQYLVTWSGVESGSNSCPGAWPCTDIYGRLISPSGEFITETFEVSANRGTPQLWPSAASNGTTYLVTWVDSDAEMVKGQLVTRTGDLLGREITISPQNVSALYSGVDVASDGSAYMAVWTNADIDADIWGQRISSSGALDGGPFVISAAARYEKNPAITYGAGQYFVTWEQESGPSGPVLESDLYGAIIDAVSGNVQSFPIATGPGCQGSTDDCRFSTRPGGLSFDGVNFIAVWADSNRNGDVYANRVSTSGQLLDGSSLGGGILVSTGVGEEWPQIAHNGSEWLAIWTESSPWVTRAVRISATGAVLDATPITVLNDAPYPPIASDGTNYMIAWDDGVGERAQLYGTGEPRASAEIPFVNAVGETVAMNAGFSLSPGGSPLSYIWDFGDNATQVTTQPDTSHAYSLAGDYTVTLTVNNGVEDSDPFEKVAYVSNDSGGGQNQTVDDFLTYVDPADSRVNLPLGTTSYDVRIIYGATIFAETFQASLAGAPVNLFDPSPGSDEVVSITLQPGRNVLKLSVEGIKAPAHIAKDQDQLVFIVK